jgi:hypothetical protein
MTISTREEAKFLIENLPPIIYFAEQDKNFTLTFRHLALEIFLAIKTSYESTHESLPPIFRKLHNRHVVGSIISIKNIKLRSPSSSSVLALVIDPESPHSTALHEAINNCQYPISIAGGSFPVQLTEWPTNSPARTSTLSKAAESNAAVLTQRFKFIRDVHPGIKPLNNPDIHRQLVQVIPNCIGIFFHLPNGRSDPQAIVITTWTIEGAFLSNKDVDKEFSHFLNPDSSQQTTKNTHPPTSTIVQLPPDPHTADSYRKVSTSALHNRVTVKKLYYSIPNPMGGIFKAGVYYGNWQVDGFNMLIKNVSFPEHKMFPTLSQALSHFIGYHKHIRNLSDIEYMNNNCPLETSNIKTPCPKIRKMLDRCRGTINRMEFIFANPNQMSSSVYASRLAASTRMHQAGLHPTDSYDFMDVTTQFSTPNRGTTPLTNPTINNNNNPPPQRPQRNPQASSQSTQHSLPVTTAAIPPHDDDEDMSVLSERTEHISLSDMVQKHAGKRLRSSTTHSISTSPIFLFFEVSIALTNESIMQSLTSIATSNNIEISCFRRFLCLGTTRNAHAKVVHLDIATPESASLLARHIPLTFGETSYPQVETSFPYEPTKIDPTINIGDNDNIPLYCPLTDCPNHNFGNTIFNNFDELAQHVQSLHNNVFCYLPPTTLNRLNWFKCDCDAEMLYFGKINLNFHRNSSSCPLANPSDSPPTNQPTANTTQPTTDPTTQTPAVNDPNATTLPTTTPNLNEHVIIDPRNAYNAAPAASILHASTVATPIPTSPQLATQPPTPATHTPTTTIPPTPTQATTHIDATTLRNLRSLCPSNRLDQLNSLISSNSTIAELNAALIEWMTSANDMTGLNDNHP